MNETMIPVEELEERLLLIEYFNERILAALNNRTLDASKSRCFASFSTQIARSLEDWVSSDCMQEPVDAFLMAS